MSFWGERDGRSRNPSRSEKKSLSLPYRNGEIWFEHLNGMYQDADWALEKLICDRRAFLLPSRPARIGLF